MASQLIIKSYTPFRYWLKVGLATASLSIIAWLMYSYGYYRAGFDNSNLHLTRGIIANKLDKMETFNGRLREKNATLEQSKRIDQAAFLDVDGTLQELQDEILELRQEVAFYRGIVAPTESASGLSIGRLEFQPIGSDEGYRYKLVLMQTKLHRKKVKTIKGKVTMTVNGILNGDQKQLSLAELTHKKSSSLKLQFKYFQNIEGDIVFPEGFIPSSVVIELRPKGKGYSRIKKNYNWADTQT
ncbi:MAG: DUF6776 family protein [Thiohalomonadales bacterium]